MKVLFIDPWGDALDLVLRSQPFHECVHYISPAHDKYRFIGKGLTKVVRDFRPWLRWAELTVLCDNIVGIAAVDAYRRENPKAAIFGPAKDTAAWETERLTGQRVFVDHGIPIPECQQFNSYEKAVAYIKKRDSRLVCKPCGDADKALSYCSKSPEDLLFMLGKWKREGKLKGEFLLQDFIPGVEFAVGAYMGRDGFAQGWEENFEHKKLMPGEIGPTTGEMGTVLQYVIKSKLAHMILKPLEKTLMDMGYTGCIDVNCIIDEKGNPWPLEFTMRMGYPALQIQTPLFPEDPVSWMYDLATGSSEPVFRTDTVSLGVSMCLPPFPYPSYPLEQVISYPVYGVVLRTKDKLHPYMIQAGQETEWMTAGDYALVATGTGQTVSAASRSAYQTLDQLHIPGGMLYRNDIGKKLQKFIPELQKHGFAKDWRY